MLEVDRSAQDPVRSAALRKISDDYDRRGASVLATPSFYRDGFYRDGADDLVARVSREWWERALPLASQTAAVKLSVPKLLDLCCGTGAFSIYPAKMGYQVWGVDLSPKSIAAAEFQAKRNGVEHSCRFLVDDAVEFLRNKSSPTSQQISPQIPEKFDVISICGSLYYLELPQVLPLLLDRLADGGTFLCMETNGGNGLLSCYRRWKNRRHHHRDQQTLTGLLCESDYLEIAKHFSESSLEFFDCLTLLTPLVYRLMGGERSRAEKYHAAARRLDQTFLKRRILHKLAFKAGFTGRKPAN